MHLERGIVWLRISLHLVYHHFTSPLLRPLIATAYTIIALRDLKPKERLRLQLPGAGYSQGNSFHDVEL